jgi:hypothetical protein
MAAQKKTDAPNKVAAVTENAGASSDRDWTG